MKSIIRATAFVAALSLCFSGAAFAQGRQAPAGKQIAKLMQE
jgi:hypothetical protein